MNQEILLKKKKCNSLAKSICICPGVRCMTWHLHRVTTDQFDRTVYTRHMNCAYSLFYNAVAGVLLSAITRADVGLHNIIDRTMSPSNDANKLDDDWRIM